MKDWSLLIIQYSKLKFIWLNSQTEMKRGSIFYVLVKIESFIINIQNSIII
jgi:hypothetical protein